MAASAYHVISKYLKIRVFRQNRTLDTHLCYKHPILTKKWNYNNIVQTLYLSQIH